MNTYSTIADGRLRLLFLCAVMLSPIRVNDAHAIVASDDPALHRVVPGETTYGLNLDGVALIGWGSPGGTSLDDVIATCTAAAISDCHLLTAAHCFDADKDGSIDRDMTLFPVVAAFELSDNLTHLINIPIPNVQFADDWPEARSDIAVIELADELPTAIPRYRVNGGFDEIGQPVVVAGYGAIGTGATGVESIDDRTFRSPGKHAGMNQIDEIYWMDDSHFLAYDFDNGQPEQNALTFDDVDSDLGLGNDEAMPGFGDSGGPVFIDHAIAGVIATSQRLRQPGIDVNDEIDSSWGEAHFDTRVSIFQHFLVDATDDAVLFDNLYADFDESGRRDAADIDLLSAALRAGSMDPTYDLDGSGVVDVPDHQWWIHKLRRTHLGDTNLDRVSDSSDLIAVVVSGKYEQDVAAGWSEGDWNGDGRFDSKDLMAALEDGGYEKGPRVATAIAVPEPTQCIGSLCVLLAGAVCHRGGRTGLRTESQSHRGCRVLSVLAAPCDTSGHRKLILVASPSIQKNIPFFRFLCGFVVLLRALD